MFGFTMSPCVLLLAALWTCGSCGLYSTGSEIAHRKEWLDPNVRDWGDYSDLVEVEPSRSKEEEHGDKSGAEELSSGLAPELRFLAEFAGKRRLWVITASSHNNHYLQMMEKQLEDLDQRALNCRLAERDTFIITIIQNAVMEGRLQKTTVSGEAIMESLDPDMVSKLLHYLDLSSSEQDFTMLVVKKNLRVSERFPYPVRVEAILELIDQFPKRKLEKMTRKGNHPSCRSTKKKVVKKMMKKKVVLSPHRAGNTTSAGLQPRPAVDKKAALKRRIQDILNGRSRFVIRKVPAAGSTSSGTQNPSGGRGEVTPSPPSREAEKDSLDSKAEEDQKVPAETNTGDDERSSKKKKRGKGNKGKKRGREASEKDRAALKLFLEGLKGTRRLMVISTPSREATLYTQQREENEKHLCQLATRKITVATMMGKGALMLQHHQLESERPLSNRSADASDPGLIALLRAEMGLSSSDLFSMTVTDYDLKPARVFEAPPSAPALFEYIDNFPSRRLEKDKERKSPPPCSQRPEAENSLLRFLYKRRLLLISAPSEEDYSFQQQLSALTGQECPLGVRHFAALQLIGVGDKASGSVQLFPLNGHSQTETEPLSREDINHMRRQLQINRDYFSMLFVEKDGEVKAWFPSPEWSLDNIYDLVDSTETRLQEEKLQGRLGIRCPDGRGMRTDYRLR